MHGTFYRYRIVRQYFQVIDKIIASGEPCEIVRGKHRVIIMPEPPKMKTSARKKSEKWQMTRLSRMAKQKIWLGTPEELVDYKGWSERAE